MFSLTKKHTLFLFVVCCVSGINGKRGIIQHCWGRVRKRSHKNRFLLCEKSYFCDKFACKAYEMTV